MAGEQVWVTWRSEKPLAPLLVFSRQAHSLVTILTGISRLQNTTMIIVVRLIGKLITIIGSVYLVIVMVKVIVEKFRENIPVL
jgi:hypothetical protein